VKAAEEGEAAVGVLVVGEDAVGTVVAEVADAAAVAEAPAVAVVVVAEAVIRIALRSHPFLLGLRKRMGAAALVFLQV
jgi:hypothetical protein